MLNSGFSPDSSILLVINLWDIILIRQLEMVLGVPSSPFACWQQKCN